MSLQENVFFTLFSFDAILLLDVDRASSEAKKYANSPKRSFSTQKFDAADLLCSCTYVRRVCMRVCQSSISDEEERSRSNERNLGLSLVRPRRASSDRVHHVRTLDRLFEQQSVTIDSLTRRVSSLENAYASSLVLLTVLALCFSPRGSSPPSDSNIHEPHLTSLFT